MQKWKTVFKRSQTNFFVQVVKVGNGCSQQWQHGIHVMALLSGGGYGQFVSVPEQLLMPLPDEVDLRTAAAIPGRTFLLL